MSQTIMFFRRKQTPIQATEYRVAEGGTRRENRSYDAAMFQSGSYESDSGPDVNFLNLPVYRADDMTEFGIDVTIGAVKISGAYLSGGVSAMGIATINYLFAVSEQDPAPSF